MSNGTTQRKGLHPLIWVGIGCAGLVVVGFIVIAGLGLFAAKKVADVAQEIGNDPAMAAEWIIKANPELELVETDREAGTMTIRDKSSGETVTVDYSEIQEGRFSFESSEGSFRIDSEGATIETPEGVTRYGSGDLEGVPQWVPVHSEATETNVGFIAETPDGRSGMLQISVPEAPAAVADYYVEALSQGGFETENRTSIEAGPQGAQVILALRHTDGRRLTIAVQEQEGGSSSTLTFEDPAAQ